MKIFYNLLCFFILIYNDFSQSKSKEVYILDKGVSQDLALYRKQEISKVSYGLSFQIPNKKEEQINANLILDLNTNSRYVYLDFKEKLENIKSIIVTLLLDQMV